jgi:probable F420-dependent oxidoreductase
MAIGPMGIWTGGFRTIEPAAAVDAAVELDALGYDAVFFPAGDGKESLALAESILGATNRLAVVTGILNIWFADPVDAAAATARLNADFPGRFLLGLGASHRTVVDRNGVGTYQRPYSRMVEYLDELDQAPTPVAPERRILAALGPRMLDLARDRAGGAHPYLTTPEHTRIARDILGPDRFLAPELKVVLERDPDRARAIAREHLARYLGAENYVNNLRRFGFEPSEFEDGGSDRLVDATVAWGDTEVAVARFTAHREAGADHVCVQVLDGHPDALPWAGWRELAEALRGD